MNFVFTAALLTALVATNVSLVSAAEAYQIELLDSFTPTVAFNETNDDDEISFFLNVTTANLTSMSTSLQPYDSCASGSAVSADKIVEAVDPDTDIGDGYSSVGIDVNVGIGNLEDGDGIYAYQAGSDEIAYLSFCFAANLGSIEVIENGLPITSSISYVHVKFNITINLSQGFNSVNVDIIEEGPEDVNEAATVSYDLSACECDAQKSCLATPPTYNQNSLLNMCISTPSDNTDIQIREIKDMDLSSGLLVLRAIEEYQSNAVTDVDDSVKTNVLVSTRLVSAFFVDAQTQTTLVVSGTATIEFTNGSRKLVTVRGGDGRSVQEDEAGTGSFNLAVTLEPEDEPVEGSAMQDRFGFLSTSMLMAFGMAILGVM